MGAVKDVPPALFRQRVAISIRGLLAFWICSCVLSMARAQIEPTGPERTSHPATLEEIKSATATTIQEQSARIMLGVGDQLTAVSNSMARKLDTLGDKLEKERSVIQALSSHPSPGEGAPTSLWVLLLANLGVGIGGLAALGLLVRHRKSVGEQVQSAVRGQTPDMMKELAGRVQPRLEAVTRQCEDLARNLGQATEKTKEILQDMEQKHEEHLGRLVASSERACQKAVQAWENQSRACLGPLPEQAAQELERLKGWDESLSALVWPAFFQGGAALAGWRKRIEEKLLQQDPCAFELFLALGRFSNAVRDAGDLRKVGEALNAVGTDAYRFWKSIGTPSLEAALEWRTGFKGFLEASGIPIDIILALEGDRFDPNTMLSVDTGSATRMYVKEALSWIVLDKSGDSHIVRHHARVITC